MTTKNNTPSSPAVTVDELSVLTRKSKSAIYNLARKLGRLPTVEEINAQRRGPKRKYF